MGRCYVPTHPAFLRPVRGPSPGIFTGQVFRDAHASARTLTCDQSVWGSVCGKSELHRHAVTRFGVAREPFGLRQLDAEDSRPAAYRRGAAVRLSEDSARQQPGDAACDACIGSGGHGNSAVLHGGCGRGLTSLPRQRHAAPRSSRPGLLAGAWAGTGTGSKSALIIVARTSRC